MMAGNWGSYDDDLQGRVTTGAQGGYRRGKRSGG